MPSIHISESDLKSVLQEVFKDHNTEMNIHALGMFTEEIVKKARGRSLSSRLIVVTNDKLLKKTEKVKLARRDHTSIFAQQLLLVRRKLKHRGIELIKPGERYWLELKEVCELATQFCNEFGLDLKIGYREYCEVGLKLMKSFSLSRFKQLHPKIYERYECLNEIQGDKFPDTTDAIYKYYLKKVGDRIGWTANLREDPTKYVYFVKIRKESQDLGILATTYVDAQFAGLEWANAIPDPTQMVGVKALDRLMKYCYENDITTKPKKNKRIDFSKIKNKHGKG